ncbi:hypothetical protein EVAR_49250_1 [Eumeta japonica]|uniref:Uncharacterized protein n=1 Tax=Eumeta variegata TaxID=151549 RepID=A0A4C1YC82_EUMVA|nr:hypothetical protein EVAR_49250_1 [Eumeta japonica]
MTVYYIPGSVREAFPLAVTDSNAIAGFACTGVWPLNRNTFTGVDIAPSSLTNRPLQVENDVPPTAFGVDDCSEPVPNNLFDDYVITSNPGSPSLLELSDIQAHDLNQLSTSAISDPSPCSPQRGPSGIQPIPTISFSPLEIRLLP